MRYLLSHVIDFLTSPIVVMLILLLVALLLRWRGRPRAAIGVAVSGVALLYLCAIQPVTNLLARPLESRFPPLSNAQLPQGIAGIAVLGAGYRPHDGIPITAALSAEGLARVAEGVRLAKRYGGNVRLVLSGGVPPDPMRVPSARGYAVFARDMGIDPASIVVLDQPINTSDEARSLSKLFGKEPFLLVTSATHMPRAMLLFEDTDAHPIPAPTSQRAGDPIGILSALVPQGRNLTITEAAIHEYIGILAARAGVG
jgi:uncharacterized SAM-binding protein YcdF (DUF218 family)